MGRGAPVAASGLDVGSAALFVVSFNAAVGVTDISVWFVNRLN
jgi:hypothetical protein